MRGTSPAASMRPSPRRGFVAEHHKPRHQNGGLEEGAETQANDLLAPLGEAVRIAPGMERTCTGEPTAIWMSRMPPVSSLRRTP